VRLRTQPHGREVANVNEASSSGSRRAATLPGRGRGRPAKLSREAILSVALALLDREGADALTMRRVAGQLGVEAMSLYRHVADRAALLEGLADRLAAEIEPRDAAGDWAEALRAFAGDLRAIARRHPAAFALVGARTLNTQSMLGPIEDVLAGLRRGGFTPARAIFAYRLVATYARGYALAEITGFAIDVRSDEPLPAIRSLSRRLASEPSEANFRAGLETILAGLRAAREAQ
jgi:AcrR family transcriptional regulator